MYLGRNKVPTKHLTPSPHNPKILEYMNHYSTTFSKTFNTLPATPSFNQSITTLYINITLISISTGDKMDTKEKRIKELEDEIKILKLEKEVEKLKKEIKTLKKIESPYVWTLNNIRYYDERGTHYNTDNKSTKVNFKS